MRALLLLASLELARPNDCGPSTPITYDECEAAAGSGSEFEYYLSPDSLQYSQYAFCFIGFTNSFSTAKSTCEAAGWRVVMPTCESK